MTRLLTICLVSWAIYDIGQSVSTKMEFDDEKESSLSTSSSSKEEDVEVKHTIVVSTKLKNNNRRGLHNNNGDSTAQTFSVGHPKSEESGEVPIIKGYNSVESTLIRTPDTRDKPPVFANPVYFNRNIPIDYNTYPVARNPSQWKPSSFFNNVNWRNEDSSGSFNDFSRRDWSINRHQDKFHRQIRDDVVREFYCRKCRELNNGPQSNGCVQQRSNSWFYQSTTPKIKLDGKLAKLN